MQIPKLMHQIWVGDLDMPTEWMGSWKCYHTNWEYVLWDNSSLKNYDFLNKSLIEFYYNRNEFNAVSDLMRYEILYNYGGFIPPSDSICFRNTDELFSDGELFGVYESELKRPGRVCPIYASIKHHNFLYNIINKLHKLNTSELKMPIVTTGNVFITNLINELKPEIKIFPSQYFIPEWLDGTKSKYQLDDFIYAKQMFGTAKRLYKKSKI